MDKTELKEKISELVKKQINNILEKDEETLNKPLLGDIILSHPSYNSYPLHYSLAEIIFNGNQNEDNKMFSNEDNKMLSIVTNLILKKTIADKDFRNLLKSIDIDLLNEKNENNVTPLIMACANGHIGIAELLLDRPGIDINAKNNLGHTALSYAYEKGHTDIVKLILKRDPSTFSQLPIDVFKKENKKILKEYIDTVKQALKDRVEGTPTEKDKEYASEIMTMVAEKSNSAKETLKQAKKEKKQEAREEKKEAREKKKYEKSIDKNFKSL